jgi:hypothetical protein
VKRFNILFIVLFMMFLIPQYASAEVQEAQLSAVEPTQNTDDSMINDLKTLRVYYYNQNTQPDANGDIAASKIDYPASSPTGGGQFSTKIGIMIPAGKTETYLFYMTAINEAGLESNKSAVGSKTFVSALPPPKPNAPAQFMILQQDVLGPFQ